MSILEDKLTDNQKETLYGHIENEPGLIDETWKFVTPFFMGGLINSGRGLISEYSPFIKDAWNGKELLMSVFDKNKDGIEQLGGDFFKKYLVGNPINTKFGTINFRRNRASETNPKNMWQFPIARFNLYRAQKNTRMPNKKTERKDADIFDNIEVNIFGKKYDYQIRNNKNDKTKDLYNIKDYKFFEKDIEDIKNNPELYQKFIELNNKDL